MRQMLKSLKLLIKNKNFKLMFILLPPYKGKKLMDKKEMTKTFFTAHHYTFLADEHLLFKLVERTFLKRSTHVPHGTYSRWYLRTCCARIKENRSFGEKKTICNCSILMP